MTNPALGYHGTTKQAAERILQEGFYYSANDYDWLGDGAYFFHDAPHRVRQTRGAHRIDRAVNNYLVNLLVEQRMQVRSVRAAFVEGNPLFPESALFSRSHVQIAVRDRAMIGTPLVST